MYTDVNWNLFFFYKEIHCFKFQTNLNYNIIENFSYKTILTSLNNFNCKIQLINMKCSYLHFINITRFTKCKYKI